MDTVPIVDLREGGPPAHARQRREQALALRAACLGWLPCGGLLARLADPLARWWLRRSASPLVGEIDAIARTLGRPGIWLLHGAYAFGCTALADESADGPVLRRTLDWPFPGLGRLVEVDPPAGRGGRVPQRHLAGLRGRADRGRAWPLRGLDQPGADAPAHVGRLAAVARLCPERRWRPSSPTAIRRPSTSSAGRSKPARRSMKRAGCSRRDRSRGPSFSSLPAARPASGC